MNAQAESGRPHGNGAGIKKLMKRMGIPLTRRNFLELEFMGEVPEHLSAEQEMHLPAQFRQKSHD